MTIMGKNRHYNLQLTNYLKNVKTFAGECTKQTCFLTEKICSCRISAATVLHYKAVFPHILP